MTDEKMLQIVAELEEMLAARRLHLAGVSDLSSVREAQLARVTHINTMFSRLRAFISEGRREKAMRWIGFIQGALWAECNVPLEAFKSMNRSDQLCEICADETEFACSDCRIDYGRVVYVCTKRTCRDAHEQTLPPPHAGAVVIAHTLPERQSSST